MSELERIPEKPDKLTEFQKKYNSKAKSIAHILGTNIALYICILLPFVLIGFIWTEFDIKYFGIPFLYDGIATVALFIIGEVMMSKVGADGGRIDPEYLEAKKEYYSLLDRVHDLGTMFMAFFCEWQIDVELDRTVTTRLRSLRLTRKDWETVKDMSYKELKEKYGKKKAKKIIALKELDTVDLNEAVLLYDSTKDGLARGGVPISGDEYIYKKTHSPVMVLTAVFSGLLTVAFAPTLASDISFAKIIYTVLKLVILLFRMAQGYNIGATAYNNVEVKQLRAKSHYLRSYLRFVEDKTYLKLGDKYGDIECFVDHNETSLTNE